MQKKEKKEKTEKNSEWGHADANALHANANECKKKREERKENLLGMGACRWECIACGWSCMWMVLRADGVVCRWCCMRMVLHADGLYGDMDGGSCRDGGCR